MKQISSFKNHVICLFFKVFSVQFNTFMHSVQRFIKTKNLYFLNYFRNEFIKIFNDLIGTRKLQIMHPEEQKEIPKNILGQDCKTSVLIILFRRPSKSAA
jgi:hypothetical protein